MAIRFADIASSITDIYNGVIDLVPNFKGLLISIFVPDSDGITGHIEEIKSYFSFVEEIKTISNNVFGSLDQKAETPVITIDLSKARSKFGYKYGGTTYALNMSWYEEYKPAVDTIIVAFCYAFFILNIFRRLPEIISGTGAIDVGSQQIQEHYERRNNGS